MQLAETKVTNANLQNQLENTNRELSAAQVEVNKLQIAQRDGSYPISDPEGLHQNEQESTVLHEAQEEINRV